MRGEAPPTTRVQLSKAGNFKGTFTGGECLAGVSDGGSAPIHETSIYLKFSVKEFLKSLKGTDIKEKIKIATTILLNYKINLMTRIKILLQIKKKINDVNVDICFRFCFQKSTLYTANNF